MQAEGQEWILISRKLNGEASPAELDALERLLSTNQALRDQYSLLSEIWSQPLPTNEENSETPSKITTEVIVDKARNYQKKETVITKDSFINKYKFWLVAASLFSLLFVVVKLANQPIAKELLSKTKTDRKEAVQTIQGEKSKSVLPDGTIVWLNAGSKLEINKKFGIKYREVSLVGEGFFDVAKNKSIPFIIHTSNIDIKVTGTSFNVKANPKDLHTETTLIQGSIEVTIKNQKKEKVIMQPNDKLIVYNSVTGSAIASTTPTTKIDRPFILQRLNADSIRPYYNAEWISNKLIFDNEELSKILYQMEFRYNVKFTLEHTVKLDRKLTVDFSKENLKEALEALKAVDAINYTIQDKDINIF
jgi:ferric-dicitrate binding protein FerR (iron transport regulator)